MQKRRKILSILCVVIALAVFLLGTISASAYSGILKKGSRGSDVTKTQRDLKALGYLSVDPTGYYGDLTTASVKKLQKAYGLYQDGIAGPNTFALINRLMGRESTSVSRGGSRNKYLVSWFNGAEDIFKIGDVATVYDIGTGLSFKAERTYGYNHADCETLTKEDTYILKKIYDGEFSWDRRPVIITVNGTKIAASMAGMPHAGREDLAKNAYASWRSGGYGAGTNLDAIKGNGMSGHFDIHFLGSKTHTTNTINEAHQTAVKKAAAWALNNLK